MFSTMKTPALPVLVDGGFKAYLKQIRVYPVLEAEEEYMLAKRWSEHGDYDAAHRLVTSHLRLVAKMAMKFRGYGLPMSDLVAEGNIGLMQAVKKFDPDKGFRLSTYAIWWIRAAIQEYILRSWSLVKVGSSAAQKKLFFNLRRLKQGLQAVDSGDLRPEHVESISQTLGVSERDVVDMNRRMIASDQFLDAPVRDDSGSTFGDLMPSGEMNQEDAVVEYQETSRKHGMLAKAMSLLSARERDVIRARRLQEPPATLEDLSQQFGVSRERIRQIEVRAMEKLTQNVTKENLAA
jgi:RNA polymerase sigma-32 factor